MWVKDLWWREKNSSNERNNNFFSYLQTQNLSLWSEAGFSQLGQVPNQFWSTNSLLAPLVGATGLFNLTVVTISPITYLSHLLIYVQLFKLIVINFTKPLIINSIILFCFPRHLNWLYCPTLPASPVMFLSPRTTSGYFFSNIYSYLRAIEFVLLNVHEHFHVHCKTALKRKTEKFVRV